MNEVKLDAEFDRLATLALTDVFAERERQLTEWGFSEAEDDSWTDGELFTAGMCYRAHASGLYAPSNYGANGVPKVWPWHSRCWKPRNPRRTLVKAGALVVADMNRLGRASRSTANRSHWLGIIVGEIVGLAIDAAKKEAA